MTVTKEWLKGLKDHQLGGLLTLLHIKHRCEDGHQLRQADKITAILKHAQQTDGMIRSSFVRAIEAH